MKLRDIFVLVAVIGLTMVQVKATALVDDFEARRIARLSSLLPPIPSPLIEKDSVLRSAYYDTLSILIEDNRCSRFYGGSATAIEVFTRFFERARTDYLSSGIGLRMSDGPITMLNAQTNLSYRVFERISINKNGPFYKRSVSTSYAHIPGVGSFQADTREVRALMLLHELGHLIKGPNGEWLLPDDGKDQDLSMKNSRKVEEVCGEQIRDLGRSNAGTYLAKLAAARDNLALAEKSSDKKLELKNQ